MAELIKARPLPGGGRSASPRRRARSRTGRRSTAAFAGTRGAATASSSRPVCTHATTTSPVTPERAPRSRPAVRGPRGRRRPDAARRLRRVAGVAAPRLRAIAANPKPLVGYSDVTALHVAIRQRTGLVTFYGPGLTSMGSPKREEWSKERYLRAMTEPGRSAISRRGPDDPYIGAIGSGSATAPLVGGCLWLLRETLGNAVGGRARRRDPLFRGRQLPTLASRRRPHAAPQRREARRSPASAIGEMYTARSRASRSPGSAAARWRTSSSTISSR